MSKSHRGSLGLMFVLAVFGLEGCGGGSGGGGVTAAPTATLSTTSVTFSGVATNSTSTPQVVTISNQGNATLDISGITLGGTDAARFAMTTTCGTTLAAAS